MSETIETHTDGTKWVACTAQLPKADRTVVIEGEPIRVYHPDARITETSSNGQDDHYRCPHCHKTWWVEYDG